MSQTIAGALIGGALGAFGKKPDQVKYEEINPLDSANQALDIAKQTMPKAQELASSVNAFNQSELDKLIEKSLPGAAQQIKSNIAAQLRGELPPDVIEQINRSVASRAAAGGFSGTGFSSAIGARDLGLTSLALTERGLNAAQRWLAQTTVAPMDVSRSFFSPTQMLAFNIGERDRRYEAERINAGIRAAPDPNMVQLAQGIDNFMKTAASVGMMMAGMPGGVQGSGQPLPGGTGGFAGGSGATQTLGGGGGVGGPSGLQGGFGGGFGGGSWGGGFGLGGL